MLNRCHLKSVHTSQMVPLNSWSRLAEGKKIVVEVECFEEKNKADLFETGPPITCTFISSSASFWRNTLLFEVMYYVICMLIKLRLHVMLMLFDR